MTGVYCGCSFFSPVFVEPFFTIFLFVYLFCILILMYLVCAAGKKKWTKFTCLYFRYFFSGCIIVLIFYAFGWILTVFKLFQNQSTEFIVQLRLGNHLCHFTSIKILVTYKRTKYFVVRTCLSKPAEYCFLFVGYSIIGKFLLDSFLFPLGNEHRSSSLIRS